MKRSFGPSAIAYPLPVFIIGTYDQSGKPNVMVAAWGGICSSDPPSVAVTINPAHYTFRNLMETNAFTVSIPSVEYMSQADYFGIVSGKDTNKFVDTGLTPVKAQYVNAPYVGEFPVILECTVSNIIELGSRSHIIGQIHDVKIDESVLGSDGKPDLGKIGGFGFDVVRMEYYSLGKVAGKAFEVGKKYDK
ncbi:MAG: flavin reductase family protein [Methanoregula sp.]|nr:flavin reductase family protein [Methanoregula sp.]